MFHENVETDSLKMSNFHQSSSNENISATVGDWIRKTNSSAAIKPSNPQIFSIPSHGEVILQELSKQRNNEEFCDVTVFVENKHFSVHKCVLSASSPYFKNLLTNVSDGAVFLRHVTAESFKTILDFLYTSRLYLDSSSVEDILSTAKFLQMKNVISICCRFLQSQIENLMKDLDEHETDKPAVISIDADMTKEHELLTFSPLQQQPRALYTTQTGLLESGGNTTPVYLHSNIGENNQKAQPFVLPCPSTPILPMGSHNYEPVEGQLSKQSFGRAQNSFTNCLPQLKKKKDNVFNFGHKSPVSSPKRCDGFCSNRPNTSFVAPQSNHFQPNFRSTVSQNLPWNNQNYASPFLPPEPNIKLTSSANQNPFNFYASNKLLVGHPKFKPTNGRPKHSSPAIGLREKVRKLNPQERGKMFHNALSDTKSLKFSFNHKTLSSMPRHLTSTPAPSVSCVNNKPIDDVKESVILLSSARSVKLVHRDKKSKPKSPTETVFDIEAEDRYWDALSTRRDVDQKYN